MVNRFERFSFAISEIHRFWHKIASDEMTKLGLKGPHVVYLVALKRFPEGVTASELSEICGRDKSDVSRAITAMEEKGLVKKQGSKQNLYRALLRLTHEGKIAATHVSKRAALAVEMGGKGLSDEERDVLYVTLERIASNLSDISRKGLPGCNPSY
ncbi:MAG: MarR family winged helix-turn-helix transcriptional regulator [Acutalibacteraceae bacterium]|nr:MarR family winged helix-turn-helix transcriptional regulator [Acutalibacteraceae bacterium]